MFRSKRLLSEPLNTLFHADICLLPRALRRAKILRPPFVAILARKPWFRFRLITLGWNVRFMITALFLKLR